VIHTPVIAAPHAIVEDHEAHHETSAETTAHGLPAGASQQGSGDAQRSAARWGRGAYAP